MDMVSVGIKKCQNALVVSAFIIFALLLVSCGGGSSQSSSTDPPPGGTGTASVTIGPSRAALTTGQTQTFTATVTGNSVTTVTWEVDSIAGGNSSVGTVTAGG
ncbi:MAG: hypothetical protein QOG55_2873, partial [Acidobacteriaceae bacterium]|nr:hypothetical protein [Acidobacteriaceae bacterium]